MKRNNLFELKCTDIKLNSIFHDYKLNNLKYYNKLLVFLKLYGNFKENPNINFYDYDKKNNILRVYIEDLNDNIFVFPILSNTRNDLFIIDLIGNEKDLKFDLTLLKKNNPTLENINLCRTDKIYNSKFGRIITDEKSFITFCFPNDVYYEFFINNNKFLDIDFILYNINSFGNVPNLKDIMLFMQETFDNLNSKIEIYSYSNFNLLCHLNINDELDTAKENYVKSKTINKLTKIK